MRFSPQQFMPQKMKKTPERKCMGCNEKRPKTELIRIVRTPEGEILLDGKGKVSGRGVYICPEKKCFEKAKKAKRFERSLEVEIPESVYEELENKLENLEKTPASEVQS